MHLRVQSDGLPAYHRPVLYQVHFNSDWTALRGVYSVYCLPHQGYTQVALPLCSLGSNLGQKEKGVLTVFIVGVQILLVFMYKFYFFDLF